MRIRLRFLFLTLSLIALSGCAFGQKYKDNRYQSPSEYFLYIPESVEAERGRSLFIALHGIGEDGADCYSRWLPYAEGYEFILLCPTLPETNGTFDALECERILSAVLNEIYRQHTIDDRFFLAGYAEGAEFGLVYASRYPGSFNALSVISPKDYSMATDQLGVIPLLITVGEKDTARVGVAQDFAAARQADGHPTRLVILDGAGLKLTNDAIRMTVDFFIQVTR